MAATAAVPVKARPAELGPVKVGGQALADGVLMRTNRAWAIARADGSVDVGALPPSPAGRIPVLRVLLGVFGGLRLAVSRGMLGRGRASGNKGTAATASGKRLNRRFLIVLAGLEAAAFLASRAVPTSGFRGWQGVVALVVPWVITLAVLRLATPGSLWRYHGAEHKAVSAHEAGIDLSDTTAVLGASRIHNRCGTNLVFLMLLLALALHGVVGGWLQGPMFVALLGVSAEVVTLAANRPRWMASRALLWGGRAIQRWVTTAEPTAAEQAVGCQALMAALAEHHRVVALDEPAPETLAFAA
jgi:uncharacterized protein YqhQ